MAIKTLQSSESWTQKGLKATLTLPLTSFTEEDGTPVVILAGTTSGFSQLASKEIVLEMPINATIEAFQCTTSLPQDLDYNDDVTVHVLVGKDADNDTLTLDCEAYPVAVADGGNADIQDTVAQAITQAISELTFTCGSDGVLSPPGSISLVFTLGGVNDGDAVYIYGVWLEYTKSCPIVQNDVHMCRIWAPEVHKLVSATAYVQNIVTTGTVTMTLRQTDSGDARGGAEVGTAFNNATLLDASAINTKREFVLADSDKRTAPAGRMYFVNLTATDPADRLDEVTLVLEYDDDP